MAATSAGDPGGPAAREPGLAGIAQEDGQIEAGGSGGEEMSASDAVAAPYGYWQRAEFTASGLSDQGGTAITYGLDASRSMTAEQVAAAAGVFGVVGVPVKEEYAWSIGAPDPAAAHLYVYSGDGGLSFYDPAADPWQCPVWTEDATDEYLSQPCVERDLGPLPSVADASARVGELLAALGFDPAEFRIGVPEWYVPDATYLQLEARRYHEGQWLDLVWSFGFTGGGLQSVYGSLADIVPLGDYEVISPAAAVARLSDPRFTSSWMGPVDSVAGSPIGALLDGSVSVPSGALVDPAVPTPGQTLDWPVSQVTITSAELALTSHYQNDGAVLLVPTYRLYSADGGIWQVVALADQHFDFADGR